MRFLRFLTQFLFVTALLVAASPVHAADSRLDLILERGSLVLGTSGNMPTMSMQDGEGKLSGLDIDIARFMADAMGVTLEPRVLPFDELIPALERGDVDVVLSNLTINPKRNLRVAFVGPYLESGKCIVAKQTALAQADRESTDLNTPDTRLAVLSGSTSENFARQLFPKVTLVPIDDYETGAELVSTDQASGLLTDYPICLATLKANPDAGFVSLFSLLTYEPIGIALPAGDAQFINWSENFLKRLDGTDALKGLAQRWFGRTALVSGSTDSK
jgi:polar amino acid transport system substrate-binding protein